MRPALLAMLPVMVVAETVNHPPEPIPVTLSTSSCGDAPNPRAVALCLNRDAIAMEHAGDFGAAARKLAEAAEVWQRDPALDPALHALILSNLGEAYEQLGRWPDAAARFEQALTIQQSPSGRDETGAASSMIRLAGVRMLLGHPDQAQRLYVDGLATLRRSLPGSALELSLGLGSYAVLEIQNGDLATATNLAKESISAAELTGNDTVAYASSLAILAGVYSLVGETARSTPLLTRAIDIFERKLGPSHPRLAALLLNRSMGLAAENKLTLAEGDARRAVDLLTGGMGADSANVAWAKVHLASIYLDEDKVDEAGAILPAALEAERRVFQSPNIRLAGTIRQLARLRARQSRIDEADALYREAISMFDAVAPGNPDAGHAMHEYAALLKEQRGSKAEIRRLESRARTILGVKTSAF